MESQKIKAAGIKPPKLLMLTHDEVRSLRPTDRDTYAEKVIKGLFEVNPRGITISEIEGVTQLNRSTITKHLKRLVAIREAYAQTRGNLSIYYKNGKVERSQNILQNISRNSFYAFHRITNEEGKYIYIQEKNKDHYGVIKVSGGIMVKDEDLLPFLRELQNFALEAIK